MHQKFSYSQFLALYPTTEACLEELRKLKYPEGIFCEKCKTISKHYKVKGRTAYACKNCRSQVFPLTETIFEKTTTPLTVWFYAMFLMIHSRGVLSVKQLQRELGVTYKTAWRMYKSIYFLMEQNGGDLLRDWGEEEARRQSIHRWTFFRKLEFTVTQKKETEE
jgi:transposase